MSAISRRLIEQSTRLLGRTWENRQNDQFIIDQTREAIHRSGDLLGRTERDTRRYLKGNALPEIALDQASPVLGEERGPAFPNSAAMAS